MKRPFAEINASALNGSRARPAEITTRSTQHDRSVGIQSRFLDRSLGRRTFRMSTFPEIDRLASLAITCAAEDTQMVCERGTPFGLAAANTCSLAAVADDQGSVQIADYGNASGVTTPRGEKNLLDIQIHDNAIFSVQWSADDRRLLTGAGDQSARLTDVPTQKLLGIYNAGHKSTIKCVRFDPTNPSLFATGARDGGLVIWDSREDHHRKQAQMDEKICSTDQDSCQFLQSEPLTSCQNAHVLSVSSPRRSPKQTSPPSITAILYKPNGQLITACAANSLLKTWDLRYLRTDHPSSTRNPYPLLDSSLPRPARKEAQERASVGISCLPDYMANKQRTYGVTSLSLSNDGQKVYSTNMDNRVYEYSTSHPGAAPTKIFQVPGLDVKTFFIQASLSDDGVLVCGNGTGKPVLVDVLQQAPTHDVAFASPPLPVDKENVAPQDARSTIGKRAAMLPYNTHISRVCDEGHRAEVTSVAWLFDSSAFVSIGDDGQVRTWRRGDGYSGSM